MCMYGERSTRRKLSVPTETQAAQAGLDTITGAMTDSVLLSGYDKPLRSRKETFFATNNTSDTIETLALTLTYLDSQRRQLHRSHVHVNATIPPGQTRNLAIPTWDSQQSFYYILSEVPARATQAATFDVIISVDTLFTTLKTITK